MLNNLTWSIVDAAAAEVGAPFYTRRSWRKAGRKVPYEWRVKIVDVLRSRGMMVAFADFDDLPARIK